MRKDEYFLSSALLSVFVFISFSYITLTTELSFGDEGFYAYMGKYIATHLYFDRYYPMLGSDVLHVSSSRPPAMFYVVALFSLFGEAGIKIIPPLFVSLSSFLLFLFLSRICGEERAIIAQAFFLTFPVAVKYGNMLYPESVMLLFTTLSFSSFLLYCKNHDKKLLLLSSISSGVAGLFDVTGLFILAPILATSVYRKDVRAIVIIPSVTLLVVLPWILRNLSLYKSPCYFLSSSTCSIIYDVEYSNIKEGGSLFVPFGSSLASYEIFNFLVFGFGLQILALLSIPFMKEKREEMLLLLSIIAVNALLIYKANPSAESLLRYNIVFLPVVSYILSSIVNQSLEKPYFLPALIPLSLLLARVSSLLAMLVISFLSVLALIYYKNRAERYKFFLLFTPLFLFFISIRQYLILSLSLLLPIILVRDKRIDALLILLSCSFSFFSMEYYNMLFNVKHQFDAVVLSCKEIKSMIPEDAVVMTVYDYPFLYHCNRRVVGVQNIPDARKIMLYANETSYELLKLWGVDYVFVESYVLVPRHAYSSPSSMTYEFLNYMESDTKHFKKIYDNGVVRLFKVM